MVANIKWIIQKLAEKLGYRIVARERDPQTILRYLETLPITIIVDVGANRGITCLTWLRAFPSAHVHAVEALDRFRPDLERVASMYPGRMTIWQVAATDHQDEITFFVHEDHPSSSSILSSTDQSHALMPFTRKKSTITVQGARLDEILDEAPFGRAEQIFLKLDVQGAELNALRGAEGLLRRVICVLCEINLTSLYEKQADFVEIVEYLRQFGLEFCGVAEQFHARDGHPIYLDAVFLRPERH